MTKKFKEIKVETDCGTIIVREYDDEMANGVQICLNDNIVAMVDCYRKESSRILKTLPTEEFIDDEELLAEMGQRDIDDIVCDYLSDKYGYCVFSFQSYLDNGNIGIVDIHWDVSEEEDEVPEARLIVYGPDCDEPDQVITLN